MLGSVRENVEECLLNILDERNNYRLSEFLSPLNELIIAHGSQAANVVLENQTACNRILSLISPTSIDSQSEITAIFIMANIAVGVDLHEEAQHIVTSKLPYIINLLHHSCTLTTDPELVEIVLRLRNDLNNALCILARHDQYHEIVKAHMRDLSGEKLLDLLVLDATQSTTILKIAFQLILGETGLREDEQLLKFLARFIKVLENTNVEFQQFLFEALVLLVKEKYYAKIFLDNFGVGYLLKFLAIGVEPKLQECALSAIVDFRAIKEGDSIVVLNNRLLMPALISLLEQPISTEMTNTVCAIFLEAITNRHNQEFFDYEKLFEAVCNKFANGVESHMQLFFLQVLLAFSKALPEHQKVILENETIMAHLAACLVDNDDDLFKGAASLLDYFLENNHDVEIFSQLSSKELMSILNMGLVDYKSLIDHVVKNIEFELGSELENEFLMEMISWLTDAEEVRLYALNQLVVLTKRNISSINFVCMHGLDKLFNCLSMKEGVTAQRALAVLVNIIQDSANGAEILAEFDSLVTALEPFILQNANATKQKYAIFIAYAIAMVSLDKITVLLEENIIKALANFLLEQKKVREQESALNLLNCMAVALKNPLFISYIEELQDIFTNADFTNEDHLAIWIDMCEGLCDYPDLDPSVERHHSPISSCDSVESDSADEEVNPHSESAITTSSPEALGVSDTPLQNSHTASISVVFLNSSPPNELPSAILNRCDSAKDDLTEASASQHSEAALAMMSHGAFEVLDTLSHMPMNSIESSLIFLRESGMVTPPPPSLSSNVPKGAHLCTPERPKRTSPREFESPERL